MKFSKEKIREAMLLYAITDRRWLKKNESLSKVCEDVLANGATCIQIREKDLDYKSFEEEAKELQKICNKYKVPFIVNDNVEIAVAIKADGVHVGQTDIKDMDKDIRQMIGKDMILGISASTVKEAVTAQEAGADYIGVGAVFATGTKDDASNISMQTLQSITDAVSIPVVAIGGITQDNLMELKGSGIDGISVISAIFAEENPGAATAKLHMMAKEMIG